jgi:beta-phosphoglucomutase
MTTNTIKGLIFDLDGVLVSTEHNHYVAWKKTADALGIPFSHAENEQLKGLSRVDSLKAILAITNQSIPDAQFEALLQSKNDFYLDSIQQLNKDNLLVGVAELLALAKEKGIQLAVGSSSKNAKFILDKLGISSYFSAIIDGNMVTYPKPHPEVFLNAAKTLGLTPADCIVFEDAASGIQAAKDGGFYAIAVGNSTIANMGDRFLNDLTEFKLSEHE